MQWQDPTRCPFSIICVRGRHDADAANVPRHVAASVLRCHGTCRGRRSIHTWTSHCYLIAPARYGWDQTGYAAALKWFSSRSHRLWKVGSLQVKSLRIISWFRWQRGFLLLVLFVSSTCFVSITWWCWETCEVFYIMVMGSHTRTQYTSPPFIFWSWSKLACGLNGVLGCRKVSKRCNAKDALLSNSLESKAHGQNPYYAQFGATDAGRSKETRTPPDNGDI